MGNRSPGFLDTASIINITTEACGIFSKDHFANAYKSSVVDHVKVAKLSQGINDTPSLGASSLNDGSGKTLSKNSKKPAMRLTQAPAPLHIIKSGMLMKRGAAVKNWKRRHFTALNKGNNFCIFYSEDDANPTAIGHFYCSGYRCEPFTDDESAAFGSWGLKLIPHDDSKRKWFVRAESESEYLTWRQVFWNACKKSQPEVINNQFLVTAFDKAYQNTRSSYGFHGVCRVSGTECERLELLMTLIINREIVDDYINQVTKFNPSQRRSQLQLVKSVVNKIVKPIIASAWQECHATFNTCRPKDITDLEAKFEDFISVEQSIHASISKKARKQAEPILRDIETRTCQPLIDHCYPGIVASYEALLRGFQSCIKNTLGNLQLHPELIDTTFDNFFKETESLQSGPVFNAQQILWEMKQSELDAMPLGVLESTGLTSFDVYMEVLDAIRDLMRNAIFTFSVCAKTVLKHSSVSMGGSGVNASSENLEGIVSNSGNHGSSDQIRHQLVEILNETISKLSTDSKASIRSVMMSLLVDSMEGKLKELAIIPAQSISDKAVFQVPKSLSSIMDVGSMVENIIRDVAYDRLSNLVQNNLLDASSRFNIVALQLLEE